MLSPGSMLSMLGLSLLGKAAMLLHVGKVAGCQPKLWGETGHMQAISLVSA